MSTTITLPDDLQQRSAWLVWYPSFLSRAVVQLVSDCIVLEGSTGNRTIVEYRRGHHAVRFTGESLRVVVDESSTTGREKLESTAGLIDLESWSVISFDYGILRDSVVLLCLGALPQVFTQLVLRSGSASAEVLISLVAALRNNEVGTTFTVNSAGVAVGYVDTESEAGRAGIVVCGPSDLDTSKVFKAIERYREHWSGWPTQNNAHQPDIEEVTDITVGGEE